MSFRFCEPGFRNAEPTWKESTDVYEQFEEFLAEPEVMEPQIEMVGVEEPSLAEPIFDQVSPLQNFLEEIMETHEDILNEMPSVAEPTVDVLEPFKELLEETMEPQFKRLSLENDTEIIKLDELVNSERPRRKQLIHDFTVGAGISPGNERSTEPMAMAKRDKTSKQKTRKGDEDPDKKLEEESLCSAVLCCCACV